MKDIALGLFFAFIAVVLPHLSLADGEGKEDTFLLETKEFLDTKDWNVDERQIESQFSSQAPFTVLDIPEDRVYHIWAQGLNLPQHPAGRDYFRLIVNGADKLDPFCNYGVSAKKKGYPKPANRMFRWQYLGKIELLAGENFIEIAPIGQYVRANALLFSTNVNTNPYAIDRNKLKREPLAKKGSYIDLKDFDSRVKTPENPERIGVKNERMGLYFTKKTGIGGKDVWIRSVELYDKEGGKASVFEFDDEYFFVGREPLPPHYSDGYYSFWQRESRAREYSYKGKDYLLSSRDMNPYSFNSIEVLRPSNVSRKDDNTLILKFRDGAEAQMELMDGAQAVKVSFSYAVPADGYYSAGFMGFSPLEKDKIDAVQLPPLFQNRFLMTTPVQLGNAMASQPYAMFQTNKDGKSAVFGISADPSIFPADDWGAKGKSLCAFSLMNSRMQNQLAFFQPVLGGPNSHMKKGGELKAVFYCISMQGDWTDAVEFANTRIFSAGNIFREPYEVSFSDALCNIAKLLKSERYGGWVGRMGGRWNIERPMWVTQSSPLAEISLALLTDDEECFANMALRTVEFALSRNSSHLMLSEAYAAQAAGKSLLGGGPNAFFDADFYASANALLGGGNPWAGELVAEAYKKMPNPSWPRDFGMYLATGNKEYLAAARARADRELEFFETQDQLPHLQNFVNVSFYYFWWYLNDLYEATGEKKYLDYAQRGAFHTLTCLWNYPNPPKESVIYKGNMFQGVQHLWWQNGTVNEREGRPLREAFRTVFEGAPLADKSGKIRENTKLPSYCYVMPEKTVDGLKVSRIGMGIEQPSSYTSTDSVGANRLNILHPSWAAEMEGVYKNTGRDIIDKFARHSIVGRFANYPGYYITDYIDAHMTENYPYEGMDYTSFYYHHIPIHFAQNMDFLISQIELASRDKIKFPFVRQRGYVWFVDRIFGLGGKVFSDEGCRLILDKDMVRANTPKVSTISARANDGMWVLFVNDTASKVDFSPTFNPLSRFFKDALLDEPCAVFDSEGKKIGSVGFMSDKNLTVPARGLIAVKVPMVFKRQFKKVEPIKGISRIMKKAAAGEYGDLGLYRIRGPFGSDALYAYLSMGAFEDKNAELVLTMVSPSKGEFKCSQYPYEISVYPLPQDADYEFSVSLKKPDGKVLQLGSFKLEK